jgi:hypothetical protein
MALQHPGLVRRSPLATMTRKLPCSETMMPTRAAASVSMKLWVEPESSSEQAGAVDVHSELHGVAMVRLDACEHVDRDGGLGGVRCQIVDVVIDHLDGEELLADCLVAISEEFITTKTFTTFPALGNIGRRQSDSARCRFID